MCVQMTNVIEAEVYILTVWRRGSHVLGEKGKIVNFTKKDTISSVSLSYAGGLTSSRQRLHHPLLNSQSSVPACVSQCLYASNKTLSARKHSVTFDSFRITIYHLLLFNAT